MAWKINSIQSKLEKGNKWFHILQGEWTKTNGSYKSWAAWDWKLKLKIKNWWIEKTQTHKNGLIILLKIYRSLKKKSNLQLLHNSYTLK